MGGLLGVFLFIIAYFFGICYSIEGVLVFVADLPQKKTSFLSGL